MSIGFTNSVLILFMIIAIGITHSCCLVFEGDWVVMNDDFLTKYLPTLVLIITSEALLSNSSIISMIDRKVFLSVFRFKHCLSLILVPRLWFGDPSIVLKSQIYALY